MIKRIACTSAVLLGLTLAPQQKAMAITNGVIFITTRAAQDTANSSEYWSDERGPGMVTPGDVAMGHLLGNYGYTTRLILDKLLSGNAQALWVTAPPPPETWLAPSNPNFTPMLIINSGSSAGADVPPRNTLGIPVVMGEHSDLGDHVRGNNGSIYMYSNGNLSTDPNEGNNASKYMKVLNASHPILQGIPLDSQGRVKIFRDAFPEENAHVPGGGKVNYEYRWCSSPASNAAPGTVVLGVLDGMETHAVLAVNDVGGLLAFNANLGYAATNDARLVHIFCNENGSGGSRRVFNSLTEIGKVIFVRAMKWAIGETMQPYQGLGLIDISLVSPNRLRLSWQASADKNYKILASRTLTSDPFNWQTVSQDIPGTNGVITRQLNIASGPQYAFLRVAQMQ